VEESKRTISAYLTRSQDELDTARLLFTNGKYKAETIIADAEKFVARMEQYLRKAGAIG
jgi:uncharacterized protein (UPF0332 family)